MYKVENLHEGINGKPRRDMRSEPMLTFHHTQPDLCFDAQYQPVSAYDDLQFQPMHSGVSVMQTADYMNPYAQGMMAKLDKTHWGMIITIMILVVALIIMTGLMIACSEDLAPWDNRQYVTPAPTTS